MNEGGNIGCIHLVWDGDNCQWTIGVRSLVTEELLASEEGLISMQLIMCTCNYELFQLPTRLHQFSIFCRYHVSLNNLIITIKTSSQTDRHSKYYLSPFIQFLFPPEYLWFSSSAFRNCLALTLSGRGFRGCSFSWFAEPSSARCKKNYHWQPPFPSVSRRTQTMLLRLSGEVHRLQNCFTLGLH
jgi:hypothetical protein